MTAPATTDTRTTELREWARVIVRALGILRAEWDRQGLAPGHGYRFAASMLESFLKDRYGV